MHVSYSSKFSKDLKRIKNRNLNIQHLKALVYKIKNNETIESKYKLHMLIGKYSGSFECHIKPDWLLIFRIEDDVLYLVRTGSHSDLFK